MKSRRHVDSEAVSQRGPRNTFVIYIRIRNSSKISCEVATKIVLWFGVTTTCETVLKSQSVRKVDNHCSKNIPENQELEAGNSC